MKNTQANSVIEFVNTTAEAVKTPGGMRVILSCAATLASMFIAQDAAAWSVPASSAFMYDVYDIAVNDVLKGPIGFVAGVGLVAFSAQSFNAAPWRSIIGILGGSAMVKADTITTSMGMTVEFAQHLIK